MKSPEIHLNPNVRELTQSATLAINELSAKLRREGRQVFRLGFGQSPFPVPQPVVEALRANAHRKDYLPVKGLHELRDAVADHYHRLQDIGCSGEDVLIGPGSKELMFILQLAYCGDLVIPTPSWVSYAPQAASMCRWARARWTIRPSLSVYTRLGMTAICRWSVSIRKPNCAIPVGQSCTTCPLCTNS